MKVHGFDVPQAVIDACTERMREKHFRSYEIAEIARRVGSLCDARDIGEETAHRIADRLIQQLRHQRKIKIISYPKWGWVEAVRT